MSKNRWTAWLRPALILLALAGMLSLAGCGGGNGAPNNPYQSGNVTPTLAVLPTQVSIYSGVPATLTITSGTAPFTAFSSDATVLPVSSSVSNTIALLASTVSADQAVTLTIRDASGQTVTVPVTVHPSLLLPASITITGNPACSGSGSTLCSGQDGTATVKLTGSAGAPLAGRSVRFDVVLGTFSLIAANSGSPAQSVTVLTDQNGLAVVTIRVPVDAATQFGTLRATDITSGSSVIAQFTIAQFVNGNAVLSVIPNSKVTFTGPDNKTCASFPAQATFYIFGGTPPYMVQTNFPTAVSLFGVPVLSSGGGFSVAPNGTCFTGLTFAITDATGRTLLTPPTVDNVVGTNPPSVPLAVIPSEFPVGGGTTACGVGSSFQFLASGGSGTYFASAAPAAGGSGTATVTVAGGNVTVSFTAIGHGNWSVNVTDGSAVLTSTIHCS